MLAHAEGPCLFVVQHAERADGAVCGGGHQVAPVSGPGQAGDILVVGLAGSRHALGLKVPHDDFPHGPPSCTGSLFLSHMQGACDLRVGDAYLQIVAPQAELGAVLHAGLVLHDAACLRIYRA